MAAKETEEEQNLFGPQEMEQINKVKERGRECLSRDEIYLGGKILILVISFRP